MKTEQQIEGIKQSYIATRKLFLEIGDMPYHKSHEFQFAIERLQEYYKNDIQEYYKALYPEKRQYLHYYWKTMEELNKVDVIKMREDENKKREGRIAQIQEFTCQ
jgi:predicted nucleotidyltransferase